MENPEIPEVKDTRIKLYYEIGPDIQPLSAFCCSVTWLFEDLQWKISQEQGKNHRALLHFINSTFSFESFQLEYYGEFISSAHTYFN